MADPQLAAEQVNDSVWLERCVRVGLVAYGLVHVVVAGLALQLAFGNPTDAASQQGAMRTLAAEPVGGPLLWALAIGLGALVAWQATEAVVGHRDLEPRKRLLRRIGSGGRAVVYAALSYSAVSTALGSGSSTSKDRLTARVLSLPFGALIVAAVGALVVGVGIGLAWQCVSQSFLEGLDSDATSGSSGTALVRVARFGYAMKGLALGVVGGLFVWVAWTYDASKAGGLDVALQTFAGQTVGPWLLAVVAVGIGCFGVYCFGWARYANTAA